MTDVSRRSSDELARGTAGPVLPLVPYKSLDIRRIESMLQPHRLRSLSLVALIGATLTPAALAWNSTGHRVIATIAYQQLDEPTKRRVADVLKHHPAYADLWARRPTNGSDEIANLFWNASIFPDDARGPRWKDFNRPLAHYVNYRILADRKLKVEPPVEGENVLNSYEANLRTLKDPRASVVDKSVALSWIFHQAGDIHQPLHSVARFSESFPEGDRGGNGVKCPNPRTASDRGKNLHAYWDDLIGVGETPETINTLAVQLMSKYPKREFAEELAKTTIADWSRESLDLSLSTVYNDLDPNIKQFADLPVGYEADAVRAARRRATLAGYRLADELNRLFKDR